MLDRAAHLATLTVLDEQGNPVELGTLWRDRTAVLVFLRHFGCIHCREHVVTLSRDIDKLRAANLDVYVIGNGTPNFIAGFREATKYDGPIYTDPSLAAYRAAQLERGIRNTLDPRAIGKTVSAFLQGHRQGRTQGDQWQQGGVLVVAPDGHVKWHHVSKRPGDNATVAQILAGI